MMTIMTVAAMSVAAQQVGVNRADMDLTVSPGEDFFEYAGGNWMKNNPLKPEYSRYGVFDDLAENNRKQLQELFAELGKTKHARGTVGQKVTDLYNQAMDSDRLNREGAAPIKQDLADVAAFNKKDVTAFIAKTHLTLGNPFFGIGVETDLKNSDMNVMWLSAGTAGLTIYDIEYQFAQAQMSRAEARDYNKLYNIRTIDQLQKDYPAIQWREYFNLMGVKNIDWVILEQPKVMEVAQKLMSTLTEQQMRDYLAGQVITRATSYLGDEIYMTSFDFYGRMLSGQKEPRPRWKRAQGLPNALLGEAVGELYVERYFNQDSKDKMMRLITNLRKSLAAHIAGLTWMSDTTKVNALVKLNSFTVKIGYPDKWRDYSGLQVDPDTSLYENIKAATIYETRRNLDKHGKPVDKDEWGMTPQTVNAYYNPTTNEICFPAAILQPPFFDVNADDATNYGAIGVVIGHEMTHGFDDQGRMFDQAGNMVDWWTEGDAQRFQAAAEKLAAQFDQIVLVKDLHANGHLTLGENIADQGGLRIAYDAFRQTQQFKDGKLLDGFTPAQRFYLSYGRIWAENATEEAIFQQTKSDPHSIGRYRVNATLRNIDTFFEAFGIKKGDKLWLDPADRAIIW